MNPLTAWNDAAIDAQVQHMLDRAVQAVAAQMGGDLEAIVLSGGFGRGEGGALRRPGGSVHIVNDFDLDIIYREPLGPFVSKLKVQFAHRRALAALAEQLADEFGMKQVDLALRGMSSMVVDTPRLADFDMRYGHRLLWGVSDPCDAMRAFDPNEIAPFEGTWLLRNRAIGLVLARLYLDRPGGLQPRHRENFYIEINKSALAMGDALWILSGRYDVSYATRRARFDELEALGVPGFEALHAMYDQAAQYKLRPVEVQYPGESHEALWQRLAGAHVRTFLWFEAKRLARPCAAIADWQVWADAQPRGDRGGVLRRWADRQLGASGDAPARMAGLRHDRLGSIACAIGLLAARGAASEAAWGVLSRWSEPGDADDLPSTWRRIARGLLSVLHPGGEVGRFLSATRDGA